MKIAVLSGKGGTGKTFVAVNLASVIPNAVYIDCDAEEPNGRLFFHPEDVKTSAVKTKVPVFDREACTGCRACIRACRFHALAWIKGQPKVFSDVCHACGLCALVCPSGAVSEQDRTVGTLETGRSRDTTVITGELHPGEASAVPVIRAARNAAPPDAKTVIIDGPPGSSCSVMESVSDADLCLLVAEPTAFGFHNFQMVFRLVSLLGRKAAVVINKCSEDYEPLLSFCREQKLPVLRTFPYDPEAGRAASEGQPAARTLPRYAEQFAALAEAIGGMLS